jgi:hypothetical protein
MLKRWKNYSNLFFCASLFLVGIIFFSSNLFTRSWIYGAFGCKFSLTIDVLCTVVSLMLISTE